MTYQRNDTPEPLASSITHAPLIAAVERLLATLPQPGSRVWPDFYARLQVEEVRRELDKVK